MRVIGAACLVAISGMLASAPARADWLNLVRPFKGNDTGGIIAYSTAHEIDVRQRAVEHCASYGKVVKFLSSSRRTAAISRSPAAGCLTAPTSAR